MTPRAGLVLTPGAFYEQIVRGPQGDSKSLRHLVSEKKNFEDGLLCSYVPTCDLRARTSFDPGTSYEQNFVEVLKEMLYTKYKSSRPSSFRVEEF